MEIILKNNWDFVLYKENDYYILKVVFTSSMMDYSRSFKFLKDELNIEIESLKKLSEQIRKDDTNFKDREITPSI